MTEQQSKLDHTLRGALDSYQREYERHPDVETERFLVVRQNLSDILSELCSLANMREQVALANASGLIDQLLARLDLNHSPTAASNAEDAKSSALSLAADLPQDTHPSTTLAFAITLGETYEEAGDAHRGWFVASALGLYAHLKAADLYSKAEADRVFGGDVMSVVFGRRALRQNKLGRESTDPS